MTKYSRRKELKRPYIIAEFNTSHSGNIEVAKRMILAAKNAGADCVKFQSFDTFSLYSEKFFQKDKISKRIFDKVSLSEEYLVELSRFSHLNNIDFSSTTYSLSELEFLLDRCRPAFIKIASMEVNNYDYLRSITEFDLPVILSTGMSTFEEIEEAVRILTIKSDIDLTVLHCTSNYPTSADEANLSNILSLKNLFPKLEIGYSDHTIGILAPLLATVLGASVIEKHFTLDNSVIGMDNQMAMEPNDFKYMVNLVSEVDLLLGSRDRIVNENEQKMKLKMRRSITIKKNVIAGTIISEDLLESKRPGTYIPVSEKKSILGKKLKVDLAMGDYLEYTHLEEE
jgi:sialic acid synthase SpsE